MLVDGNTRIENEWLLVDGDRVYRRTWSHRVWSAGELCALLQRHGFGVLAVDGDLAGTPYDLESDRLLVVAER